ncbi:MAG: hypothetical protein U1D96_05250 [Eubacteriales bacterium]|nr:hypothetical protein [Clostridia bacterium]MDZ4042886.1 hypothetical protein [Eubacteriales bacterium]
MPRRKRSKKVDNYMGFLMNSELARNLSTEWFTDSLLASALLIVLIEKKVINYDDVLKAFSELSRNRLERILEPDQIDTTAIPDSISFSR